MTAGVYTITHAHSGRVYIGHAVDVAARWRLHRYHLRHGTHDSQRLQEDWDRDGAGAFRVEVLEAGGTRAREAALIRVHAPAYNTRGAARSTVSYHHCVRTQEGAHTMTTSGGSERVALNARVDPAIREQARQTADARGMALNDLIVAAVTAYCQPPTPAPAPEAPAPPATIGSSEQGDELLRLAELMAADMHMVRTVLQRAFPQEVAEAKQETRGWLLRLRSALPVAPPTREGGQGRGRPC